MSVEAFYKILATAETAGPVLNTFTTGVSCLPTHAKHTIMADDWWLGKRLIIRASGNVSNVVTAQPTFTFDLKFGATTGIWNSGAILTSTTAHTTVPWMMYVELTCRAVGSTSNLMGQGWILSRAFLDAGATADITTLGHTQLLIPEGTPAVGANFDSNASQQVDLTVACSTSNAGNGVTLQQYELIAGEPW